MIYSTFVEFSIKKRYVSCDQQQKSTLNGFSY